MRLQFKLILENLYGNINDLFQEHREMIDFSASCDKINVS